MTHNKPRGVGLYCRVQPQEKMCVIKLMCSCLVNYVGSSGRETHDLSGNWSPTCSPPSPLPSLLHITVNPLSPVVAANSSEVTLTCSLDSYTLGSSWSSDVGFSWELNGSAVPGHQYWHSLALNGTSVLTFAMSTLTEGLYRCIASLDDANYPITGVSPDVRVELPSRSCNVF